MEPNWFKASKDIKLDINQEDANKEADIQSNLIESFSFDNFISKETNEFAKKIAFEVSQHYGKLYNPLIIYGKNGLGKTHLINAIGNHITQNSNKLVLYITCKQFIDDVMKLDENSFKQKYSYVDVLLLDDLQDIKSSKKAQQILKDIIKDMISTEKQIVVASNVITNDMYGIDYKLKNLLDSGVSVFICPNIENELVK